MPMFASIRCGISRSYVVGPRGWLGDASPVSPPEHEPARVAGGRVGLCGRVWVNRGDGPRRKFKATLCSCRIGLRARATGSVYDSGHVWVGMCGGQAPRLRSCDPRPHTFATTTAFTSLRMCDALRIRIIPWRTDHGCAAPFIPRAFVACSGARARGCEACENVCAVV